MPTITLIGPGAIGGMVAAWLCQDPSNLVSVAARTPFSKLILEVPGDRLSAAPRVLTEPSEATPSDWVMVATKSYDSQAAADWFPTSLQDLGRVAILQNGVDHIDRFSQWLPREKILPVIVDCPAERLSPGVVRQRGPASLKVPAGALATTFCRLFDKTGIDCRPVEDFTSAAWRKLCLNAAGVVNALILQPARIAHDDTAARLMRLVVEEAAAVGRAEGAQISHDIAKEVVEIYGNQPPDSINSLHADRAAGRPMEIEIRNGVIIERGRQHGIPTPYNDMAVSLLKID